MTNYYSLSSENCQNIQWSYGERFKFVFYSTNITKIFSTTDNLFFITGETPLISVLCKDNNKNCKRAILVYRIQL